MKILFLSILKNKLDGPTIWKNGLIKELKKNNLAVEEIYPDDMKNTFLSLSKIRKSNVIHSYSQSPGTIFYIFLSKLLKKKIIHTLHGDYFREIESKKGLKKILWITANDYCIKNSNIVTFPSKYLYNQILSYRPFIKDKSIIIPNGIDDGIIKRTPRIDRTKIGLTKKDFVIIEVTNFNHYDKINNLPDLINSVLRLNKRYHNLKLIIVGDGKYFEEFKNKYKSKNVIFLGFRKDAIGLIKTSDLFIHVSQLETFSYVLLESLVCGKPIITTNVGGIPEVVGNYAFMVNSIKKLDIIIEDIYNDIRILKMNKNKYNRCKNFYWDVLVNKFLELYINV